jgi:hypothetical protein
MNKSKEITEHKKHQKAKHHQQPEYQAQWGWT